MLLRVGALLCLFGAIFPLVRAELFTALVHMEGLVELEGELASELRSYIRREKDRLRELERWSVRLFVVETCTFVSATSSSSWFHVSPTSTRVMGDSWWKLCVLLHCGCHVTQ